MKSASVLQGLCLALLLSRSRLGVLANEGKDESKGKERKQWEARDKDDRKVARAGRATCESTVQQNAQLIEIT